MIKVVGVRFKKAGKIYYFDPKELHIEKEDFVVVETARGIEFGECVIGIKEISEDDIVAPLKSVIRVAQREDIDKHKENKVREKDALSICLSKIEDHKLNMKLIDVEYTFDNNKVIFYFTADGRVDFRELVKDLATIFKTRIELRQIGVRDEAKMLGGLGLADGLHCLSLLSVRSSQLGATDLDRQHRETLAHVVVELASEQGAFLFLSADEATAQLARLLFGPPAGGHVAKDSVGADRAAAGIAHGCARQVLDPPLVAVGVHVAILDGEPLLLTLVHLPAQLHRAGAVFWMHVLHPEVQDPKTRDPLRRDAAQGAQLAVRVHDARAEIHLVEREAGELRSRRQPCLAGAQRLLGTLALSDVDGDTHQAIWLAGGRATRSPTRRDPALPSLAWQSDPVLDDGGASGRRCRPLDGLPDETPVVRVDDSLETLDRDALIGREPEDRPGPRRSPEDTRRVVEDPEPRIRGVRREAQTLLTLAQGFVGPLTSKSIGEDLGDELQALHHDVRPFSLRPGGVEPQSSDVGRATHQQGDGQVGLDPEQAEVLTVESSRLRQLLER